MHYLLVIILSNVFYLHQALSPPTLSLLCEVNSSIFRPLLKFPHLILMRTGLSFDFESDSLNRHVHGAKLQDIEDSRSKRPFCALHGVGRLGEERKIQCCVVQQRQTRKTEDEFSMC